jgi:hypothetical protein
MQVFSTKPDVVSSPALGPNMLYRRPGGLVEGKEHDFQSSWLCGKEVVWISGS